MYIIFTSLIDHLNESIVDTELTIIHEGIKKMQLKMDEYWLLLKNTSIIPMIMDPRFKLNNFENVVSKGSGKKLLQTLFSLVWFTSVGAIFIVL